MTREIEFGYRPGKTNTSAVSVGYREGCGKDFTSVRAHTSMHFVRVEYHSHNLTAIEMIQIISFLLLLASASSQSASSTVEFSVSNSELVNQLSYQSTTASDARTYKVIQVGDTVITSSFASSSSSNASSGTGSGSTATNIVAWKSSPSGIAWGTFSQSSNANSNSGIGQSESG